MPVGFMHMDAIALTAFRAMEPLGMDQAEEDLEASLFAGEIDLGEFHIPSNLRKNSG
jgi:hypothetical protein